MLILQGCCVVSHFTKTKNYHLTNNMIANTAVKNLQEINALKRIVNTEPKIVQI
jgi:hypothetical protein